MFACIGQLEGREKNTLFHQSDSGEALTIAEQLTVETGEIIDLPADVVHSIENPGETLSRALHLYAGDFSALMEKRSLWDSDNHQEKSFSFKELVGESIKTMQNSKNDIGLRELAKAIPSAG